MNNTTQTAQPQEAPYSQFLIDEVTSVIKECITEDAPATLQDIVEAIRVQTEILPHYILPLAMYILVDMQSNGLIEAYDQVPFHNPMDYAWAAA